jgi:UDP-N-acetylmuramyl pentapeptide phosphotransferase/UDP-N-acetylglucosamine-1-phosphate transferase
MGGIAIVAAAVVGYTAGHLGTSVAFSRAGLLVVAVMVSAAILGFLDDIIFAAAVIADSISEQSSLVSWSLAEHSRTAPSRGRIRVRPFHLHDSTFRVGN